MIERAKEVFDIEVEGLRRVRDSIGGSFATAVEMILACGANGGIVVVTGVGKSLHVAQKMSATFSSTGTRSVVLDPVQAMHGDLGLTSARDVLLAISFSGESDEVLRLIPAVRRHGLKVISITGGGESSLAKMSDVNIAVPCGAEACPFGMAPTNSTTATLAMGDALAMVLVDAQKFKVEDYAMNHPAGAIGRALVMKVADIMRTGEHLAKVAPGDTVMDALMAMTKAQSGSAVVVDAEGKLAGIFTDGDFRRLVSERVPSPSAGASAASPLVQGADGEHQAPSTSSASPSASTVLSDPISRYMTKSPKFVYSDAYAVELLKIFEKRHIDDLPVCDKSGKVAGLVDIQDLPKMKVM